MADIGAHRGVRRGAPAIFRRAGQVIAASMSVLLFAGFGYGYYNFRDLTGNQQVTFVQGLGHGSSANTGDNKSDVRGAAQNILIVGVDSRAGLSAAEKRYLKVGLDDQSTSTDTIIVVHVPSDGSRATLLSIPRDTYVDIPGYRPDKINAAFADGYYDGGGTTPAQDESNGSSLLVRVVKKLTGLQIDHYVQVGFSGFVNIVKVVGTVPIDLCDAVDDTAAVNRAAGVVGGSGFRMSAGHHNLDPQQALEFVRQRHNIPGPVPDDLGREARQRYFLKQAFAQVASAGVLFNPVKLHQLISAVDGAFTFDSRNFGIVQFSEQISQLTSGHIGGQSIDTTGSRTYPYPVGTALTVNPAQVRRQAHDLFYGTKTPATHAPRTGGSTKPRATDPAPSGCIY